MPSNHFTTSFITPMPPPGSSKAPKFVSEQPTFFLEQIKLFGHQAGIEDLDELVNYIVWYSSEEIQCRIQYIPALDPDVSRKTWVKAVKTLTYLYCSMEEVPTV